MQEKNKIRVFKNNPEFVVLAFEKGGVIKAKQIGVVKSTHSDPKNVYIEIEKTISDGLVDKRSLIGISFKDPKDNVEKILVTPFDLSILDKYNHGIKKMRNSYFPLQIQKGDPVYVFDDDFVRELDRDFPELFDDNDLSEGR